MYIGVVMTKTLPDRSSDTLKCRVTMTDPRRIVFNMGGGGTTSQLPAKLLAWGHQEQSHRGKSGDHSTTLIIPLKLNFAL